MSCTNHTAVLGQCFHSCLFRTLQHDGLIGFPNSEQELEDKMCGNIHRRGQLCGSCQQNHTPPVYSYYVGCVHCPEGTSNWFKFILAAFLPLTAFCIGILVFRVSATSGHLAAFVLVAQVMGSPGQLRVLLTAENNRIYHPLTSLFFKTVLSLYGIWNLDFFRILYQPFCPCPHQIISESPCIHFLTAHTPLTISIDDCVQSLIDCSEDMFEYGHTVHDSLRAIWPH